MQINEIMNYVTWNTAMANNSSRTTVEGQSFSQWLFFLVKHESYTLEEKVMPWKRTCEVWLISVVTLQLAHSLGYFNVVPICRYIFTLHYV